MDFDIVAILVASVAQFIIGAIWFKAIFASAWNRIHGFDAKPPEAAQASVSALFVQFVTTIMMTFVLSVVLQGIPAAWNMYGMAGFLWLGFIVPTQVRAVLFGGTDSKWVVMKIAIMAGASLVNILVATYILTSLSV